MHLARFPRVQLGHLMTPLEFMPRLTALLGGPHLYIKRDDCTGLATGGNKTRKLEFLMADALAQGATTVITQGATQSNHARQTAAAAARLGLACEIVLEDRTGRRGCHEVVSHDSYRLVRMLTPGVRGLASCWASPSICSISPREPPRTWSESVSWNVRELPFCKSRRLRFRTTRRF